MDANELCFLSALELRAHYGRRALSPVEVTQAVLARIERLNPGLNAYITVTADLALRHAVAAEQAYAAGCAPLSLQGIPVSLKDLTPTRGIRTTRGSLLWRDWVPEVDAPIVERIYAAGGVLLGKTNTPEMGWKGDSGNRLVGPTHNPWQHGKTAGGSSGGAGAAVAAGLGPLAQGTDGAGSIRIPSAFCGIFGLKPSFGLIPYAPASSVPSLAHMGPMARTVRDAALLLDVLAGPDARDRLSLPATGIDYLAACDGGVRGLRVAYSPDLGYVPVDPEVAELVARAAAAFADLGCAVEEIRPGFADPFPVLDTIWSTAQAGFHRDDFTQVREQLDPGRVAVIERGFEISGAELAQADARQAAFAEVVRRFMEPWDILLTPTLPVPAFTAGADHPNEIGGQSTSYLGWTAFTYPFNLTGQPAATVPCGLTRSGLPVGLQIVGRWHDDATVLRAAAAFEEARPWAHLRPPVD